MIVVSSQANVEDSYTNDDHVLVFWDTLIWSQNIYKKIMSKVVKIVFEFLLRFAIQNNK